MWGFMIPLALGSMFPSTLLPTAVLLFAGNLVCAVVGPYIGKWVDHSSRHRGTAALSDSGGGGGVFVALIGNWCLVVQTSVTLQAAAQLMALVCLFLLFPYSDERQQQVASQTGVPLTSIWTQWQFVVYYASMVVLHALGRVFAMAELVSVERDWVVTLTRGNKKLLSGLPYNSSALSLSLCVCFARCVCND
jgi:hypothetical protein